jgi:hypothetical protein
MLLRITTEHENVKEIRFSRGAPSGAGVGCGLKGYPPRRSATAVGSRHPAREGISRESYRILKGINGPKYLCYGGARKRAIRVWFLLPRAVNTTPRCSCRLSPKP